MGGTEECRPLPDGISYTNGAVVLLGSLQPVTNYTLRVRVDYPSTEVLYSDNETFTTASKEMCDVSVLASVYCLC